MSEDVEMQRWQAAQTRLTEAHAAFQGAAAVLPADRRNEPGVCGHWSPKQVVAHLAGWDREAVRALQAKLQGAPEDFVTDVDGFNRASTEARAHLSWEGACWELGIAHEALQHTIQAIRRAQLSAPGYLAWMDGRLEDYALHTDQLRVRLPSRCSESLLAL